MAKSVWSPAEIPCRHDSLMPSRLECRQQTVIVYTHACLQLRQWQLTLRAVQSIAEAPWQSPAWPRHRQNLSRISHPCALKSLPSVHCRAQRRRLRRSPNSSRHRRRRRPPAAAAASSQRRAPRPVLQACSKTASNDEVHSYVCFTTVVVAKYHWSFSAGAAGALQV